MSSSAATVQPSRFTAVDRQDRLDEAARWEVIAALEPLVRDQLTLLAPIDRAWQPADHLPNLAADDWQAQLEGLREAASGLSDDLLVVLVGDMVTEEALPSYSMALNGLVRDGQGTSPAPWACWLRGWTAEENRHGDLLRGYLHFTGRVDMRAVERTIQHLLAAGFDPETDGDPYRLLVYTSFQERATRVSHANVGRLAAQQGDSALARVCRAIAADEARHETFYTRVMRRVIDLDPARGILSFHAMVRGRLAMPGLLMTDGRDASLFDHFAIVAQRTGVYTLRDYAAILEHLVDAWAIASRQVSGPAARAQEALCRMSERYERRAGGVEAAIAKQPRVSFGWIHGRPA